MDDKSKVCSKCGVLKPRSEFYPKYEKKRPGRVTGACKDCIFLRHRDRYIPHPKKRLDPSELKENCPKQRMWDSARTRAKQKGLPFDITPKDIEIPEVCPVLGITLQRGKGRATASSPSLDRLVPSLGYVKGNIVVMSNRANAIKQNAGSEEILRVGQWLQSKGL